MNGLLAMASLIGFIVIIFGVIGVIRFSEWCDAQFGHPAGAWVAVFFWGVILFVALIFLR